MQFLVISGAYMFETFRAKTNITIQRFEVLYQFSKLFDLE